MDALYCKFVTSKIKSAIRGNVANKKEKKEKFTYLACVHLRVSSDFHQVQKKVDMLLWLKYPYIVFVYLDLPQNVNKN